jgi:hypothetical protein
MNQTTLLVTNVLLLTVPLHHSRVCLPALLLIIGMFVPPLLLAVAHHLAILGIPRQLLSTRIRAALALTIRLAANPLLGTVPRRQKGALAVKTTTSFAHVGSSDESSRNPRGNSKPDSKAREIRNGYAITDGSPRILAIPKRRWTFSESEVWRRPMLQKMWS